MSAEDFVHCNKCFARYRKDIGFFLTTCGHLLCHNCNSRIEMNNNSCIICHAQTRSTILSSQLNPKIMAYFQPMQSTLESLEETAKIIQFQERNAFSLLKFMMGKYNYIKSEGIKMYKMINEQKKEIARLRKENDFLKRNTSAGGGISIFSCSTPRSEGQTNSLFNTTMMSSIRNSSPNVARYPGLGSRVPQFEHPRAMNTRNQFPSQHVQSSSKRSSTSNQK